MKKHLTEEQIKTLLNALELAEGKPTLYLDMDGVVADFEKTAGIWGEKLGLTAKAILLERVHSVVVHTNKYSLSLPFILALT